MLLSLFNLYILNLSSHISQYSENVVNDVSAHRRKQSHFLSQILVFVYGNDHKYSLFTKMKPAQCNLKHYRKEEKNVIHMENGYMVAHFKWPNCNLISLLKAK